VKVELEQLVALDEAHAGDPIGYTRDGRLIRLPGGGAPGDGEISAGDDEDFDDTQDEGEEEDDEEDDDGEDEDGDESAEGGAPTQQQLEDERLLRRRANHESQARRKLLEQLGVKFNRSTGEPSDPDYLERLYAAAATLDGSKHNGNGAGREDDGSDEADSSTGRRGFSQDDVDRAVAREVTRAEARAEARYKPALARLALDSALRDAGWGGASADLAMRMLDLDEVDIDGDEVVGIREQVEDLKTEFPSLFKAPRRRGGDSARRGAEDVDGPDKRRSAPPPRRQSWEQQIASRFDGK